MKKNRIFAIVALLAVIVSSVVMFQSCKKNEPVNNIANKKPIAVKNTKTGEITYNVELSKIQSKIDEFTKSKGGDEILVESWCITEDGIDNSPVLRLSVIDTDIEGGAKIGFFNSFVETECKDDEILYYLNEQVSSGNYSYLTSDGEVDYIITVENNIVVSTEIYGEKAPWTGLITVECKAKHGCCNEGGCMPTEKGCTSCTCFIGLPCEQKATGTFESLCLTAF